MCLLFVDLGFWDAGCWQGRDLKISFPLVCLDESEIQMYSTNIRFYTVVIIWILVKLDSIETRVGKEITFNSKILQRKLWCKFDVRLLFSYSEHLLELENFLQSLFESKCLNVLQVIMFYLDEYYASNYRLWFLQFKAGWLCIESGGDSVENGLGKLLLSLCFMLKFQKGGITLSTLSKTGLSSEKDQKLYVLLIFLCQS